MAFAVRKLPDEPILIVTVDLPLDRHAQNLRSLTAQILRLAVESDTPLYCIIDARTLDNLAFSDILLWLAEARTARTQEICRKKLHVMLAGTHQLLEVAARKFKQQMDLDLLIFPTLEEAQTFIRDTLAGEANDKPDT